MENTEAIITIFIWLSISYLTTLAYVQYILSTPSQSIPALWTLPQVEMGLEHFCQVINLENHFFLGDGH